MNENRINLISPAHPPNFQCVIILSETLKSALLSCVSQVLAQKHQIIQISS